MFADNFKSSEERQAAAIAKLYAVHKAHDSLGTFYQLYPEGKPREYQYPAPRQREDEGRER